ncbi:DUF6134 family protein [Nisaea acidiphila]|uniref:DUF6134 family protein n=1 Tax=Nisaea acidiphila TaxID=1862145 RepID=A0A9J7AR81_9PROT|nr:DUF6134 family protein [Nisaea acidiphila]UUX49751.1 DUF6134 family protein [Nisaea acidiphila]
MRLIRHCVRSLFGAALLLTSVFAVGGAAAATLVPEGWAADGLIKFKVYRNGDPLGVVMLRFDVKDGRYIVDTQTLFDYRVGPFTLYYYALRAQDEWDGSDLLRARGVVNDDGEVFLVDGRTEAGGFRFTGSEGEHLAPLGSSVPSTYWNHALTDASRLIDLQYGRLRNITMTEIGPETIEAEGRKLEAVHYEMRGELDLDIWYDQRREWVKMTFVHDGADFDYVRVAPREGDKDRFIELDAVEKIGSEQVRVVLEALE